MALHLKLPYLNWDLLSTFQRRSSFLTNIDRGVKSDLSSDLPESAKELYMTMKDDPNRATSLHPRRSLDQFFYSSLPDISQRDRDQVVSKNTGASRGGAKMIMIDQLWLWVIDAHHGDYTQKAPSCPASPRRSKTRKKRMRIFQKLQTCVKP